MGQFLSIALVESSLSKVKATILDFSNKKQGHYKTIQENSIQDNNILYSTAKSIGKSTTVILFPDYSEDFYECSKYVSSELKIKVLTAHIHDGDVWLVYLFNKGKELTRFLSDPDLLNEKGEDWICDLNLISSLYSIRSTEVSKVLQRDKEASSLGNTTTELFSFLRLLGYPIESIQDYENGYKPLLKEKDLFRITKSFLTIEDLRTTKRYTVDLLKLDNDELIELYGEEIELVKSCEKCLICNSKTINNEYFLSIDELCLQVKGDCPYDHEQPHLLLNYGFIHKMEEIQKFLNK